MNPYIIETLEALIADKRTATPLYLPCLNDSSLSSLDMSKMPLVLISRNGEGSLIDMVLNGDLVLARLRHNRPEYYSTDLESEEISEFVRQSIYSHATKIINEINQFSYPIPLCFAEKNRSIFFDDSYKKDFLASPLSIEEKNYCDALLMTIETDLSLSSPDFTEKVIKTEDIDFEAPRLPLIFIWKNSEQAIGTKFTISVNEPMLLDLITKSIGRDNLSITRVQTHISKVLIRSAKKAVKEELQKKDNLKIA